MMRRSGSVAAAAVPALLLLCALLALSGNCAAAASGPRRQVLQQAAAQPANATAGAAAAAPAAVGGSSTTNASLVPALTASVYTFWLAHGRDTQHGGFHATLDRAGAPIAPTNKTVVQHARQLWAFSALLLALQGREPTPRLPAFDAADVRAATDSAYAFLRTNFAKPAPNGTLFVYEVAREGANPATGANVTAPGVSVAANAEAIGSLAKYARATNATEPLALALSTFEALDTAFYNPSLTLAGGGYDESNATLVFANVPLPAEPEQQDPSPSEGGGGAAADDGTVVVIGGPPRQPGAPAPAGNSAAAPAVGGAQGGSTAARRLLQQAASATAPALAGSGTAQAAAPAAAESSTNTTAAQGPLSVSLDTMLALAEALTELSRATNGTNPRVTARLLELVNLLSTQALLQTSEGLVFLAQQYDPRTFYGVGPDAIEFGTDIEAAWLLADALAELERVNAADADTISSLNAGFVDLGVSAVNAGYDNTTGGMLFSTTPGNASSTQTDKVWWVQMEALNGLAWLACVTQDPIYSSRINQTVEFVARYLWDRDGSGELFWQVPAAGGAPLPFESGVVAFPATVKATTAKTSYEDARALLRLLRAGY